MTTHRKRTALVPCIGEWKSRNQDSHPDVGVYDFRIGGVLRGLVERDGDREPESVNETYVVNGRGELDFQAGFSDLDLAFRAVETIFAAD